MVAGHDRGGRRPATFASGAQRAGRVLAARAADDAVRSERSVRHVGVVLRGCAQSADRNSAVRPSSPTRRGHPHGAASRRSPMRPESLRSAPRSRFRRASTTVFDLAQMQPQGTFISAMVEIYGGGGFVEQRADSASGSAVSPCSNSTSSTWYFADGYTVEGSKEDLVITNPFPSNAIVSIQRGDGHRESTSGDPAEPAREGQLGAGRSARICSPSASSCWRSPSRAPAAGSSSAAPRSTSPRSAEPASR